MKKMIIKNAVVVKKGYSRDKKSDILIKDGIIDEVADSIDDSEAKIIDAEGMPVMPGFIDMYCKICEDGYENKGNVIMFGNSAIAGGFTSITSLPDSQPVVDNKTVVEYVNSKTVHQTKVNIFPYASITKGCKGEELAEMGEMRLAGAVAISEGSKECISNAGFLRDVFLYSKMLDCAVITNCCDSSIACDGDVNNGYMSTKLGLKGIPREAEEIIVTRNIILAKYTKARVHIANISTEGSVDLIRNAKQEGVKITCNTCPHYFSLTESELEDYNTFAKVRPPLRTENDVRAIKEGLKDGTIDVIATGHSPSSLERKNTEFGMASFGISALETAFAVTNTYLSDDKYDLYSISKAMTLNPSKILGLDREFSIVDPERNTSYIIPKRGKIEKGHVADLIIVDPDAQVKINASKFYSRAKYSLFDGMTLKGKILKTIIKGEDVTLK